VRTGEAPADDGDPITTVILEHLAAREQKPLEQAKGTQAVPQGELLPPIHGYGSTTEASGDSEELKRRKHEYEKLKDAPPGMEQVLRPRDSLNALTFERGESPPSDKDLLHHLVSAEINRVPVQKKETGPAPDRREQGPREAGERGPKHDVTDAVAGAGL